MPLLSGDQVYLQDLLSQDIPTQLVRVGPLFFWNQYMAFLSRDLPTKPQSSSSTSTTTTGLAPSVLFGPGTVAGKVPPATGSREAKEKRAPLFLFWLPTSKAEPEKPIIEEKQQTAQSFFPLFQKVPAMKIQQYLYLVSQP